MRFAMLLALGSLFVSCNDTREVEKPDSGKDASFEKISTVIWDQLGFGGNFIISGKVTIPNTTYYFSLRLFNIERPNDRYEYVLSAGNGADVIEYRIQNLTNAMTYKLMCKANLNEDLQMGQPGDAEGYYDGTIELPIYSYQEAREIVFTNSDIENADFGIGIL